MSEPSFIERSNAYIVAEGASFSPPWWVMLSARCLVQSVGPAAAVAGANSAMAAEERGRSGYDVFRLASHSRPTLAAPGLPSRVA